MLTKHTPGPWVAWDDGRTIGIVDAEGEPLAVAEVVDYGDQTDELQILADQGLIAAAPEMLRALVAAADALTPPRNDEEAETLATIRAAIRGATGSGLPDYSENGSDCAKCEGCGVVVVEGGSHVTCSACNGACRLPAEG